MSLELIQTERQLSNAGERLAREPSLALDTESASFHRYVDRVYLIQISSGTETVLVDPLAVEDLAPIGGLLEAPNTEVVFHDADYDLRTLDRDYGFRARRLFDTRVAAQFAGEESVGLAALLEKYFGVRLNKKLQRADWSVRPLTDEMIAYAADDTRHLIELKDLLHARLEELGRLAWANEEFARLEDVRWPDTSDEDAYLRVKGSRTLTPRQRAVLRATYEWRDSKARELDRAPFRIMTNAVLSEIAKTPPTTASDLKKIKSLPRMAAGRWARELIGVVRTALDVPEDQLPKIQRRKRPRYDASYDRRLEQLKDLRNQRALVVGIDPGLLCPNGTLQAVARLAADGDLRIDEVPELRRWQREVLGDGAIGAAAAAD